MKTNEQTWRRLRLAEVCREDRRIIDPSSRLARTLPYISLEHIESGTGRILKDPLEPPSDSGRSTTFGFDERHVLYGKLRPYLNKVALPNFAGRCTTELIPLLPHDGTNRDFLAWLLRRKDTVDTAMQNKTGSRMPRADMGSLLQMKIDLPPWDEQKRIATRLREQMATVESARRAAKEQLTAAKALATSYLRKVFDSPETERWIEVRLGDVCEFLGGMQPPAYSFKKTKELGYVQLVQIQDFRRKDTAVFIREEDAKRRFDETDVMIGRYGPPVFQILRGLSGAYNVALMKATPKDTLTKDFLFYLLKEEKIQRAVIAQSDRSAGQSGVQKEFLEKYLVKIPPISEQIRLAIYLDNVIRQCGEAETNILEQIGMLNSVPSALLRRAFLRDPLQHEMH